MGMICLGILVTYCTPLQQPATAGATFCQTYRPIRWSAQDTRGTKEQVDKMNRIYVRLCGGKK